MILAEFVHDSKCEIFTDDQQKCDDNIMKALQSTFSSVTEWVRSYISLTYEEFKRWQCY